MPIAGQLEDFTFELLNGNDPGDVIASADVTVGKLMGVIIISYPSNGNNTLSHVSFTSYGTTTNPSSAMGGTMSKGSYTNNARYKSMDADGNWGLTFVSVTADSGYTLDVSNAAGDGDTRTSLTVI